MDWFFLFLVATSIWTLLSCVNWVVNIGTRPELFSKVQFWLSFTTYMGLMGIAFWDTFSKI